VPFEIIKPDTRIDFVGQAKYAIALSLTILVLAAGAVSLRGMRFGVDFTGGIEMQLRFPETAAVEEGTIRSVLGDFGMADAEVVRFGDEESRQFLLRLRQASAGEQGEFVDSLRNALAEKVGAVEVERVEFVGPKVGEELRRDGILSLTIASLLLLVYIGVRFTPVFAPGAIVAQVHDVLVTASLLVLLGREFDLTVLAALLAILGYSINDKIVIYDRIRENMAVHTTYDFPNMVNDSLNQTLSRTVLTGGTAIFSSFALFVWGGPVIATFGLAMALGIIVGTYSSLYIATPILLALQARYGKKTPAAAGSGRKTKTARA
jgi:preprotein translocase subunit SecF